MKAAVFGMAALAALLAAGNGQADEVTLESVPPVVVKTVPEAGASAVDAALTEIKVIFSKNMQDGSWSWATLSKETFPRVAGEPKYEADKRTCVLPIKLEPGKTYALWLNSQKFGNFKDTGGRSAVPYLLVFKTAAPDNAEAKGHADSGLVTTIAHPVQAKARLAAIKEL